MSSDEQIYDYGPAALQFKETRYVVETFSIVSKNKQLPFNDTDQTLVVF